jgi:nitrogen fixation NifU-like protein
MDHYKHPRHTGVLSAPDAERHEKNPSCGDELTLQFAIKDDVIMGL